MAKSSVITILTTFDYTPPIYNLLAHFSYLLFGCYDIAIRYPSVVAGILLIPAAYWLGSTYYNELTGLYLSFFTLVILPFEYYSQYGRAYILSVLFFTLLLIYYIKVKRYGSKRDEFIFWGLVALNVWIHLFTIIPIAVLCLDILLYRKNWYAAIVSVVLCSLPVSILLKVLSDRNGAGFAYGASPLQLIVLIPLEFFNTVFLNVIVLFVVGIWLCKDKLRIPLAICTIITLVAGVVASIYTPIFPRYLMSVSLIFLLFAAVGCVKLTEIVNKKVGKNLDYVIFIVIIIIFTWMAIPNFESHFFIQQYAT